MNNTDPCTSQWMAWMGDDNRFSMNPPQICIPIITMATTVTFLVEKERN